MNVALTGLRGLRHVSEETSKNNCNHLKDTIQEHLVDLRLLLINVNTNFVFVWLVIVCPWCLRVLAVNWTLCFLSFCALLHTGCFVWFLLVFEPKYRYMDTYTLYNVEIKTEYKCFK